MLGIIKGKKGKKGKGMVEGIEEREGYQRIGKAWIKLAEKKIK